jgi:hypothetical protein
MLAPVLLGSLAGVVYVRAGFLDISPPIAVKSFGPKHPKASEPLFCL